MKWSWRIGRVAGIDIAVHATFPLLLAWIAIVALGSGTAASALFAVVLTLAVFVTVVLHELGHALTARHFGIRTTDITLLPIGGIARLEHLPREPRQELLITLAGPAVNVALAAALAGAFALRGDFGRLPELITSTAPATPSTLLAQLIALNLWLAAFNLIPAFPLDGGRVLRAILAARTRDYVRATLSAARVGRAFALVFGLVGLFVVGSPVLVLIALFVWLAAAAEAAAVQTTDALGGVRLSSLMITDIQTLAPADALSRAAQLTIAGFQQDFPVVEGGALVGMLSQRDLVRGLAEHGGDALVRSVMRQDFGSAAPDDAPEEALRKLTTLGGRTLPIVRGRELLGVLTAQNVMEFVTLRSALRHAPR